MQQRHDELEYKAAEPSTGLFSWRRIPGTSALAMTNLLAAGLFFDNEFFDISNVHVIARAIMPHEMWASLFAVSGLLLLYAAFTRRLLFLNIGGAISLFVWTAISVAGISSWMTGQTELSPIAGALFFWMMAGQASMLIVPLVGRGRSTA